MTPYFFDFLSRDLQYSNSIESVEIFSKLCRFLIWKAFHISAKYKTLGVGGGNETLMGFKNFSLLQGNVSVGKVYYQHLEQLM